jgi:sugar lactone lactonase YvrE
MKSRFLMPALFAGLLFTTGLAVAQTPVATAAPTVPMTPVGAKPGQAAPDLGKQLAEVTDANTLLQLIIQMRQQNAVDAELKAWERLVQLRPHIGRYRYEMAARFAALGKKSETYNALLELQSQGYAFDARADNRFEKAGGTEVWDYILQGFDSNRAPYGEGKVAYTLPKEDLLIESVAWDPTRKELLVGSAREGRVYRVDKAGKLQPLVTADADNGMWAVFDIVVDAKRNVLWVASTAMPHFKGYNAETDLGRAGVFKFDLKTGKFLKKFLSPTIVGQNYILSALALGKDGEVYAADGINNAVYQVRDDQFRRLFHAPKLSSIRGLAVSGDGKTLYLGDHELGVIGYDLGTGKPFDVRVPEKLSLGLIEGIAWSDGNLVAVQNGLPPSRVMLLHLSDDGRSIASVQPLAANNPNLTVPTLGTLDGKTFYVIANSQKDNYDRFGLVKDKDKLQGTRIFAVDATFVPPEQAPEIPNLRPADMQPGGKPIPAPGQAADPTPAD